MTTETKFKVTLWIKSKSIHEADKLAQAITKFNSLYFYKFFDWTEVIDIVVNRMSKE